MPKSPLRRPAFFLIPALGSDLCSTESLSPHPHKKRELPHTNKQEKMCKKHPSEADRANLNNCFQIKYLIYLEFAFLFLREESFM